VRRQKLEEEHGLRTFENRVLRRIYGCKRGEIVGDARKLHERSFIFAKPFLAIGCVNAKLRSNVLETSFFSIIRVDMSMTLIAVCHIDVSPYWRIMHSNGDVILIGHPSNPHLSARRLTWRPSCQLWSCPTMALVVESERISERFIPVQSICS
jgi:hypothetical protein